MAKGGFRGGMGGGNKPCGAAQTRRIRNGGSAEFLNNNIHNPNTSIVKRRFRRGCL